MSGLFKLPYQSNPSLTEKLYIRSLLLVLREVTVLMHGNLLHPTVKMGDLRFKVFILIIPIVQWYMMSPSELTLL